MTRGLLTCYLATGLAAFMGVLPLKHLYMDWRLVLRIRALPQVLQAAGCGCRGGRPCGQTSRGVAAAGRTPHRCRRRCRRLLVPTPLPPAAAAAWPQVWRLLTNFTFLGKPSLAWLFQLVWL